jgi:hypothetical protein
MATTTEEHVAAEASVKRSLLDLPSETIALIFENVG